VQRYFRAALKDGQSIVTALSIDMVGTFNMSATAEQWKPFTSQQRVVTCRPGFLWDARISMVPGLTVRVVDSYVAGEGLLCGLGSKQGRPKQQWIDLYFQALICARDN
jgi:hypothetical protein